MMKTKKVNLNSLYNNYLKLAGLGSVDLDLMSEEEKVERKRSFMAGIFFLCKFINENISRLTPARAGDMLKDIDRQLKIFWKQEYDRIEEEGKEPENWDEMPGLDMIPGE